MGLELAGTNTPPPHCPKEQNLFVILSSDFQYYVSEMPIKSHLYCKIRISFRRLKPNAVHLRLKAFEQQRRASPCGEMTLAIHQAESLKDMAAYALSGLGGALGIPFTGRCPVLLLKGRCP
jgi:hypothetical protein